MRCDALKTKVVDLCISLSNQRNAENVMKMSANKDL